VGVDDLVRWSSPGRECCLMLPGEPYAAGAGFPSGESIGPRVGG